MTITVLLPTTVAMPAVIPDGTRYVPYDPYTPLPEEHLDAEVLGVWGNPDPQLADAARRLRRLRLVQLFSAGSDNARRAGFAPGVVIASGRGLHDRPVAEHTLALVLAAARRLHRAFAAQRKHEWATDIGGLQPEPSPGVFSTLRGARVSIWGFGSIGRTLEPHLTALGATVTGVARSARQEGHVTVVDESHLLDQLARTDVLIMILPVDAGDPRRSGRETSSPRCPRTPGWSTSGAGTRSTNQPSWTHCAADGSPAPHWM